MAGRPKRKDGLGQQFAALPMKEQDGETLVLLVTSRDTGRWLLPKGWAEKKLTGGELAAKEAYEEAGIEGRMVGPSVGSYTYEKNLPRGKSMECFVEVFPMQVTRLLDKWPESKQRRREWFTLPQAALQVEEGGLVKLLLLLGAPARELNAGGAEREAGRGQEQPVPLEGK